MQQRDEAWFAIRAGKFTGSRFADLMARTKSGPSASRANLLVTLAVERLTGKCVETYTNQAMQRGIDLEQQAKEAYQVSTGEIIEDVAWIQHPDYSFVGVSPDGVIGDGLIEIKCPANMAKHYAALIDGSHAQEYKWQIQGQLWVSGAPWCKAVSYDPRFPDGMQLAITVVHPDKEAIAELEKACLDAEKEVNEILSQLKVKHGNASL